ncbi:hypothetical protein [Vulcanococcus sp.]|uniref:hypothetical protein n=1 Tax=Vulcanococcus sp. TaxID=2856995 RepID=UPI003BFDDFC3
MTPTAATLLCQLARQNDAMQAAGMVNLLTGATIVTDENAIRLVFKKQTGKAKLTHLEIAYNEGTDLYDLKAHRMNKRTFECPEVWALGGVYAEDLKAAVEEVTGLYFTMR